MLGNEELFLKLRVAAAGILPVEDVRIHGEWFTNEGVMGLYEINGSIGLFIRDQHKVSYMMGKLQNLYYYKKLVQGIVTFSNATSREVTIYDRKK